MTKQRIFFFLLTIVITVTVGTLALFYAKGYRFNSKDLSFGPNGLLVVNSDPQGAQIVVDSKLVSATDATIPLAPGVYDVVVKKEGFIQWSKKLTIEKEIVTQVDVVLFSSAPSLSAFSFSGAFNPTPSTDLTKIAFGIPVSTEKEATTSAEIGTKTGLWVITTSQLPIGFNSEPKQITDGNLEGAKWEWSPDNQEILISLNNKIYLAEAGSFKKFSELKEVTGEIDKIRKSYQDDSEKRLSTKLNRLPKELVSILKENTKEINFSPDGERVLYKAIKDAKVGENLATSLPGSSTQKQERDIKKGKTYVYYIKEDRNFAVTDNNQVVYWLPTSRHLVLPEENKVVVMEDDGTNIHEVFSGSYVAPYALPFAGSKELLLLTNFGGDGSFANLYSLKLQ